MSRMNENKKAGQIQGPRQRWQANLLYLLIGFVALSIGVSLYLNYRLTNLHTNSVRDSKQWTARFAHHARLRQLLVSIRASANNLFDARVFDKEAVAMVNTVAEFNYALDEASHDVLPTMEHSQGVAMSEHFDDIDAAMQAMAQEGERIIEDLKRHEQAKAREHMLQMNPYSVRLHRLLNELDQQGHQLLAERLDSQTAAAIKIENNERIGALLIALLVGGVLVYGGRMSQRAAASASEKQRYDEALRASERRYRELVENSQGLICTHDLEGYLLSVNRAAAAALGYEPADMIGHSLRKFIPPPYQEHFGGYLELIRREKNTKGLVTISARDGSRRIWMFSNSWLEEPSGRTYILGHAVDVTDLKRTEAALQESRQHYENLVNSLNEVVFQVGMNGCWTFLSPAWERITGFAVADSIGKPFSNFVHPDDRRQRLEFFDQMMNDPQAIFRHETRYSTPDGGLRWLEVHARTTLDAAGKVIGSSGTLSDITERKRTEEALRQSEALLRGIGDNLPDGVIYQWVRELDGRFRFTSMSAGIERMVGIPAADVLADAEQLFLLFLEEDQARILDALQEAVTNLTPLNLEVRRRLTSGEIRWIHISVKTRRLPNGATLGEGIELDITERKRTEEALRESEERYRDLFENASDLIQLIAPDGSLLYVNRAWREALGYTAEEVEQLTMLDVIHPDSRAHCRQVFAQLLAGERVGQIEAQFVTKDGRILVVEGSSSCSFKDGKAVATRGIFRDVTERKALERELIAAREAALNASRAKSDFLANMSHEIRTPMNAVIGMTGLLLDTSLDEEQRDYVDTVRSSSDALLTIINDILDFSKIESGKLELEEQPFDLRDCIEESLDLLAAQAASKGIELAYLVDANVPATVVGDIARLRQVLVNLLSNGVKFTPAGEVVVRVTSRAMDDKAHELHFTVQDTGIGIPADRFSRLFQSFSQVDSSTTRHYGGTGLGLVISKRLAVMMGGTMWAESREGHGSTFQFTIRAAAAPGLVRVYLRSAPPQLAGKRLLIVDDNETNRRILSLQAQSWGMTSCAVASGREALELIGRGEVYDVAVLDRLMPEMDGIELAKAIREHHDKRALPVVMLTSLGWRDEDAKAACHCFEAQLTKPIKPSNLYDVLLDVLDQKTLKRVKAAASADAGAKLGERVPLRILLAEDNNVSQRVAVKLLGSIGYRADAAANGIEVLAALDRQAYDVVLMDMQMPEMDGLEAARRICRRWPAGERPYVIAMTANAMAEHREQCIAAGMDDYITKPVRIENLSAALESWGTRKAALNPVNKVEVVEHSILDEVCSQLDAGEGDALAREIFGLFLEDSQPQVRALREALSAQATDQLSRTAHALKGSSSYIGANRLAALCAAIERAGREQDFIEAAAQVAQLETEMVAVRTSLESRMLALRI